MHLNQPVVGIARDTERRTATGSSPPTAASSPSATRTSTARPARCTSTNRSSAWRRRRTVAATGSSRPTAASSASATRTSTGRPARSRSARRSSASRARPSGRGYWIATADGRIFNFGDATPMPARARVEPDRRRLARATRTRTGTGALARRERRRGLHDRHREVPRRRGGASGAQAVGIARGRRGTVTGSRLGPSGPPLPPNSGSGRRIVYSNKQQRLWLVEANGVVSHSFLVSGRHGLPSVGVHQVFSKVPSSPSGDLTLPWTLRFAIVDAAGTRSTSTASRSTRRLADRTRLAARHAAVARLRPHEPGRRQIRLGLVERRHDRGGHRLRVLSAHDWLSPSEQAPTGGFGLLRGRNVSNTPEMDQAAAEREVRQMRGARKRSPLQTGSRVFALGALVAAVIAVASLLVLAPLERGTGTRRARRQRRSRDPAAIGDVASHVGALAALPRTEARRDPRRHDEVRAGRHRNRLRAHEEPGRAGEDPELHARRARDRKRGARTQRLDAIPDRGDHGLVPHRVRCARHPRAVRADRRHRAGRVHECLGGRVDHQPRRLTPHDDAGRCVYRRSDPARAHDHLRRGRRALPARARNRRRLRSARRPPATPTGRGSTAARVRRRAPAGVGAVDDRERGVRRRRSGPARRRPATRGRAADRRFEQRALSAGTHHQRRPGHSRRVRRHLATRLPGGDPRPHDGVRFQRRRRARARISATARPVRAPRCAFP